jgi:hypothetical protein
VQRGADCVEAAGGRRVIAKANTPSKSPSGVRHGLCPWWTTLSEFIIFSIQYSVFSTLRTFHEETGSILDTEGSDGLLHAYILHAYGPDLQLHSRLLYCVCLCTRLLQLCESKA